MKNESCSKTQISYKLNSDMKSLIFFANGRHCRLQKLRAC